MLINSLNYYLDLTDCPKFNLDKDTMVKIEDEEYDKYMFINEQTKESLTFTIGDSINIVYGNYGFEDVYYIDYDISVQNGEYVIRKDNYVFDEGKKNNKRI